MLAVLAVASAAAAHWLGFSRPGRQANEFVRPFRAQFHQRLLPCGDWYGEPTFTRGDALDRSGERPLFRLYFEPSFVGPTHIRLYANRVATFHLPMQEEWRDTHPGVALGPGERPPVEAGSAPLDAKVVAEVLVVLESSVAMMDPTVAEQDVLDGYTNLYSTGPGSCARSTSASYETRMGKLDDLVLMVMDHASLTDPAELAESTAAIRAAAQRVARTTLRQP